MVVPPGGAVATPAPAAVVQPAPAPTFGMKQVEEISRNLTVQCSFTLIDAVTGQSLVQFSPPAYQKVDKSSPDFLFGSMHQEELDPVDHFIGELVEQAVQEFVSLMVPTEVEYHYELLGKHARGEAGVRAVRADDFDAAYAAVRRRSERLEERRGGRFRAGGHQRAAQQAGEGVELLPSGGVDGCQGR